jgi:hypothetical protein
MKYKYLRKLRKLNDNYWKNYSIRNIDDFNTYAEYLKEQRYLKIKIFCILGLVVVLILAYVCLTR